MVGGIPARVIKRIDAEGRAPEQPPAGTEPDVLSDYPNDGSLVRVLEDWCPPFAGYHLYYPSRRQPSPASSLVATALRM